MNIFGALFPIRTINYIERILKLVILRKDGDVDVLSVNVSSTSFESVIHAIMALLFEWYFNNGLHGPPFLLKTSHTEYWIELHVMSLHLAIRVSFLPTVNIQILYSYSRLVFLCVFCLYSIYLLFSAHGIYSFTLFFLFYC